MSYLDLYAASIGSALQQQWSAMIRYLYKGLLVTAPALMVTERLQPPYATPVFASPSSVTWPSHAKWAALNNSINGRLQELRPWAAVCYTSDPLYDEEKCQSVLSGYTSDMQREPSSAALLWQNWESCGHGHGCGLNYSNPQPISGQTCHQGSTPPYTVSILNAQDASTVVKWAAAHNVKITVKNTGHDYLGRSAAPHTLQVNTHSLNNMAYTSEFVPRGSHATPVSAVTLGAGAQIHNIYKFAEAQRITPVVGFCLTVGVGGFIQGGGHSPLTPVYGLGVDNALEFEIVTADGQIRIANEAQNSDLFWALRGGGAGSWGIVISITLRVYPQVSIAASVLSVIPNASQDAAVLGTEFVRLAAKYQNHWVNTGITSTIVAYEDKYTIALFWPTHIADMSVLYPYFDDLKRLSSSYTIASNSTSAEMYPSIGVADDDLLGPFFEQFSMYGASNVLSSRFVPQSALDPSNPASIATVAKAIWSGVEIANKPLVSNKTGWLRSVPAVLLGNMPSATASRVNSTGANPGLYSAAWHVAYSGQWTLGLDAEATKEVIESIHDAVSPLKALGFKNSYQNEGDPFEEDWQQVFFGYKYAKLSSIKQKYDPKNFFNSYKGVASATDIEAYKCYAREEGKKRTV